MRAARSGWLIVAVLATATMAAAEEAHYVVRGDQLPITTVANGYVQMVTPSAPGEVTVHVTTSLDPIGAEGTYSTVIANNSNQGSVPPGFTLPATLAKRLRGDVSAWAAATHILEWVILRIRLDENDTEPQDALSVLRRRRGRCSGLANATAALLLTAGFEARTVSGLLVGHHGGIPHRWVECYLPGAGWVPTDPTLGLWTITPRHIAFADAVQQLPAIDVAISSRSQISTLPLRRGLRMRPNQGIELTCRVVDFDEQDEVIATLSGPTGEVMRSRLAPEGRFTGLLPGRWSLLVELDGKVVQKQHLRLRSGDDHSLIIHLPRTDTDTTKDQAQAPRSSLGP
jgi:hypothetical protein